MTRRAIKAEDTDEVFTRAHQARLDPVIHWSGTRESIVDKISAKGRDFTHLEIDALAAVGLHPGADGWEIEDGEAPAPAWLTAAVLAALPGDGEALGHQAIVRDLCVQRPGQDRHAFNGVDVTAALAHLVNTGEIEAVEGGQAWRRWGVPEGWGLRPTGDGLLLVRHGAKEGTERASIRANGKWTLWEDGCGCAVLDEQIATPPTLAAARQAALRACHERGVFGPRPVAAVVAETPQGAGMGEQGAPTEDRPSRLRAALLSVLSGGPVEGLARLLPALDAAMGESTGVARTTGAEARQAAREAGVAVDGARWSVPAMVAGFQWLKSYSMGEVYYLGPISYADMSKDKLATVESANGACAWQLAGAPAWSEVDTLADGQAAALTAARLAGLFARPVTGDGGPPVLPAVTALGGEAVAKVASAPLASGHALAAQIERMVGIREGQSDCSLARMIEAFAVGVEERAFQRMHDIAKLTAEELRAERDSAIPHATVQAQIAQRAYAADAPLLYAVWQAAVAVVAARRANAFLTPVLDAIDRLATILNGAEYKPTDPGPSQPCPSCAAAERDARIWQERATEAETHGDEARATLAQVMAERASAERAVAEARLEAEAAERRAAAAERERDEARVELAALREGVDGLRTWAAGAKGGRK